jgi:lipopolysaccharide transport system permease protein
MTDVQMATSQSSGQKPVLVIRAYGRRGRSLFRDFYEARHMFWNMVRTAAWLPYNDLVLGFLWTMIRPLVFLLVVVFIKNSSKANMGNQAEYELFVFAGIISWWYFSDAALGSAQSVYNHRGIISKMYFPRVIIPVIPVVVRGFDWSLQFIALFVLMAWFGRGPDADAWVFPLAVLGLMLLALAVGFIGTVLSMYFRDVQQVFSNLLYVGFFLSPVIFSPALIPEKYQLLYKVLNPAVGPLTNIRAGLFDVYSPDLTALAISYAVTFILLAVGIYAFTRIEADLPERVL